MSGGGRPMTMIPAEPYTDGWSPAQDQVLPKGVRQGGAERMLEHKRSGRRELLLLWANLSEIDGRS